MKCIECRKETDKYLCPECKSKLRENYPNWADYIRYIDELIARQDSPKKDYIKACIMVWNGSGVSKSERGWLYDAFFDQELEIYDTEEQLKIKGWLLDALWQDYEYEKAEEIATELALQREIPFSAVLSLADYYTRTRRYDAAASILRPVYRTCAFDEEKGPLIAKRIDENDKRYKGSFEGKGEYLPNPRENREEIKKKYTNFLATIGIEAEYRKPAPKPIPKEEYPHLTVVSTPDFDSFVAFDFETTGFSPIKDAIIEVGAIKVINGKVVESEEYIFREFVKPYKSRVTSKITEITGINARDVENAREMWEVIPDFLKFADGLPLVGYNNACFDNGFLERVGRYSHIYIENDTFDVMQYAKSLRHRFSLNQSFTLGGLSGYLGIKNPKAHRAYADALTTAKVLIELKRK